MKRLLFLLILIPNVSFADITTGKASFAKLCASCHGMSGLGDGPVGKSLPPAMKPRNLQTEAMKYASDKEKFAELLKKGGAAVGLNPLMPAQANLTDSEIADLYEYVTSLKK